MFNKKKDDEASEYRPDPEESTSVSDNTQQIVYERSDHVQPADQGQQHVQPGVAPAQQQQITWENYVQHYIQSRVDASIRELPEQTQIAFSNLTQKRASFMTNQGPPLTPEEADWMSQVKAYLDAVRRMAYQECLQQQQRQQAAMQQAQAQAQAQARQVAPRRTASRQSQVVMETGGTPAERKRRGRKSRREDSSESDEDFRPPPRGRADLMLTKERPRRSTRLRRHPSPQQALEEEEELNTMCAMEETEPEVPERAIESLTDSKLVYPQDVWQYPPSMLIMPPTPAPLTLAPPEGTVAPDPSHGCLLYLRKQWEFERNEKARAAAEKARLEAEKAAESADAETVPHGRGKGGAHAEHALGQQPTADIARAARTGAAGAGAVSADTVPEDGGGDEDMGSPHADADADADADAADADADAAHPDITSVSVAVRVKWAGLSHLHQTWELCEHIQHLKSYRKVVPYLKNVDLQNNYLRDPEVNDDIKDEILCKQEEIKNTLLTHIIPERVVGYRVNQAVRPRVSGVEYLVKWTGLDYEHCTWEAAEDLKIAVEKETLDKLMEAFNTRAKQIPALYNSGDLLAYGAHRPKFDEVSSARPPFLSSAEEGLMLRDYQIRGINFMLYKWTKNTNVILADEMGLGKAQPVDELVLTPSGWTTMGELQAGDHVIGSNGQSTLVTDVYPQGERIVYRLWFSDGATCRCCEEHLWKVRRTDCDDHSTPDNSCEWQVKELRELTRVGLTDGEGKARFEVPLLTLPETVVHAEDDPSTTSLSILIRAGSPVPNVTGMSLSDRICLIRHLCTGVPNSQFVRLPVQSHQVESISALIRSVGGISILSRDNTELLVAHPIFGHSPSRYITKAEILPPVECQCIRVEAADHMYVTRDYVLTHNTVQTSAFMAALVNRFHVPGPFLVIVPVSTIPNWQRILNQWCPDLNVVTLTGNKASRKCILDHEFWVKTTRGSSEYFINRFHVLLTTPTLAAKHIEDICQFNWRLLAIDEAHTIKNFSSQRYRLFSRITTEAKLLITGTPIQNSLKELWALLHFLHQDKFPTYEGFMAKTHSTDSAATAALASGIDGSVELKEETATTEATTGGTAAATGGEVAMGHAVKPEQAASKLDPEAISITTAASPTQTPSRASKRRDSLAPPREEEIQSLQEIIRPFIIRRIKKNVEKHLPPKRERILRIGLAGLQRRYYRFVLEQNYAELTKGTREVTRLQNIVAQLKKVCNHPFLFPSAREQDAANAGDVPELDRIVEASGKMRLLDKLLTQLNADGHRVLIFSQMVMMLDILQRYCQIKGYGHQRLQGSNSTNERRKAMDDFNEPGSTDFVFLLSTRAGGLGINLATADTVILFDSDWNPQNDIQACARCHRIGQTRAVNIYRFVTRDSVEEKILETAKRKMILDHLLIQKLNQQPTSGTSSALTEISKSKKKSTFQIDELRAVLRFGASALFGEEKEGEKDDELDIGDILQRAEEREIPHADNEFLANFEVTNINMGDDTYLPPTGPADGEEHSRAKDDVAFWKEMLIPPPEGPVTPRGARRSRLRSRKQRAMANLGHKEVQALVRLVKRYGTATHALDIISDPSLNSHITSEQEAVPLIAKLVRQANEAVAEEGIDIWNPKSGSCFCHFMGVRVNALDIIRRHREIQMVEDMVDGPEWRLPTKISRPSWCKKWTPADDTALLLKLKEVGFTDESHYVLPVCKTGFRKGSYSKRIRALLKQMHRVAEGTAAPLKRKRGELKGRERKRVKDKDAAPHFSTKKEEEEEEEETLFGYSIGPSFLERNWLRPFPADLGVFAWAWDSLQTSPEVENAVDSPRSDLLRGVRSWAHHSLLAASKEALRISKRLASKSRYLLLGVATALRRVQLEGERRLWTLRREIGGEDRFWVSCQKLERWLWSRLAELLLHGPERTLHVAVYLDGRELRLITEACVLLENKEREGTPGALRWGVDPTAVQISADGFMHALELTLPLPDDS
eukprot:gnl/Dysnectes_brevis/1926_a2211_1230.p1 GENE.gnl/Dysnectes_brevis/1926_a2211_1230~~gnl/Dysnectes_brevis/1926_a2211_1230.p1  ORF type:complete len:1970 (+),score=523.99 gnl/Dysnectes_brevis/1926_a2211_1230:2006-7915(+)